MTEPQLFRRYKKWEGNTKFLCKGRLLHGPDRKRFYFAVAGNIIPMILLVTLVWPEIYDLVDIKYALAIYIITGVLWLYSITFHITCAYMDPGILPRMHGSWKPNPIVQLKSGAKIEQRWCGTCRMHKPYRATHCGICNNCVSKFDHHCPWIGNCVGARNYKFFMLFILTTSIMILCTLGVCILDIVLRTMDSTESTSIAFKNTLASNPTSFILCFYCLASGGFVIALSCFHVYLIKLSITTNEYIKHTRNEYSRGLIVNCYSVMCAPQYQSNVQFRKRVEYDSDEI
eukprot:TRINITY_DN3708_c0_g1_i1.p1 TRINITY_DN3708_c0_g1~~TRINITY_DN3708_c0_g1_i1.p1  ORF type:complete len:287 (+),score=17.85 TRINITY_DN3708_c0_g1_i1:72-932(+)